jgi:magnesium-transporting ATPase (P-type)
MGRSGSDVAREAADVVLLDDHFATIVAAIAEGRATFGNIRRFLTYHLTDNVAELTPFVVWALSGGKLPLALGVLQILMLDIVTDLLPALALGAEPPRKDHMPAPMAGKHLIDASLLRRVFGVLGPTQATFEMAAFAVVLAVMGWSVGDATTGTRTVAMASGAAFIAVVLGQIGNAFACRSTERPVWSMRWDGNRFLLVAVAVELLLLLGLFAIGPIARLLGHRAPPLEGLGIAAAVIPAILLVDAAHKRLSRRAAKRASAREQRR